MTPYVVVLRFASGTRVDILPAESSKAAIGEFTRRCLAATDGPELPLVEALGVAIPPETIASLDGAKPPRPPALAKPAVHVVGMLHALRAYSAAIAADRSPEAVREAQESLTSFFDRHGVRVDFSVGRPT